MIGDHVHAFADLFPRPLAKDSEVGSGSLAGLTFAVKDNYGIAGRVTGNGSLRWKETHLPATRTAPVLQQLREAGARLVGVTYMDELAYSILGMNAHFGTPLNPAAPDRIPGGSSSGSASAVAAGLVDFALGTDTGGSVRVPASFCGLLGLRPTHGCLDTSEITPLAPSFDVPGWFARDIETMVRIGSVLGLEEADTASVGEIWCPDTIWAELSTDVRKAFAPVLEKLASVFEPARTEVLPWGSLDQWFEVFRVHQAFEAWQLLGRWIEAAKPEFDSGIGGRFAAARDISLDAFDRASELRSQIRVALGLRMSRATVIAMPTAPGPAPLKASSEIALEAFRTSVLKFTCIAGLNGLPELTLPLVNVDGAPVGLSLLAGKGKEALLFEVARALL